MNQPSMPRISVVTPSFNQGQYLADTIESILGQGYPNLEYIVIDGGSTDDSLEVIDRYRDRIDYCVSEPDDGQADAIRKGLAQATGDIFNWVNSDDLLAPNALFSIAAALERGPDVIAGDVENFGKGHKNRTFRAQNLTVESLIRQLVDRRVGSWHQPGVWLKTRLVRDCGGIDASLHYRFDFDLLLRYLALFPHVSYLEETTAYFRLHNESKTVSEEHEFAREDAKILQKVDADPRFNRYRSLLAEVGRTWSWHRELEGILSDTRRSRFERALEIVLRVIRTPGLRFDRGTRKYLRRVLGRGGPKSERMPG